MEEVLDIIIIGGGVAGLSAAYTIKKDIQDAKLLVLEANDRLGGRLYSTSLKGPNESVCNFDLGGHWVSRTQPHTLQLLKELGLQTHWQDVKGNVVSTFGEKKWKQHSNSCISGMSLPASVDLHFTLLKLERYMELVPPYDIKGCQYYKAWDGATLETFKQHSMLTQEGKAVFDSVASVTGALPSQLSFLYFSHFCQVGGGISQLMDTSKPGNALEMTVKGGTYQIINNLAENIGNESITLNARVKSVYQDDQITIVTTENGKEYRAKFVIISIPVHCKSKIHYDPPLPRNQAGFLERMPMSHTVKFVATYETKFWKDKGFSGESRHYRMNDDEMWYVQNTMDSSADDVPALIGFIHTGLGGKFSDLTKNEQKEAVLRSLVRFFGKDAENPIDFILKDWSFEPNVGGCPVGIATPGNYTLFDEDNLRKPFGKIYWAGTETATLWKGYIDGAIQSGMRSAYEVLMVLKDGFIVPTLYSANDIKLKQFSKEESFLQSIRKKATISS